MEAARNIASFRRASVGAGWEWAGLSAFGQKRLGAAELMQAIRRMGTQTVKDLSAAHSVRQTSPESRAEKSVQKITREAV